MAPKKRSAEGETDTAQRATKVARTSENSVSPPKSKNGTKKAPAKVPPSTAEFTAKALPLHVNLTHTPPSITNEGTIDTNGKEEEKTALEVATSTTIDDVGFIGNLTLVPSSFSTGSYGWKGSKRITVELQRGDVDGEGGREKVQVMLSINATVIGSKPSKSQKGKKGKKDAEEEEEQNAEAEGEDEEIEA